MAEVFIDFSASSNGSGTEISPKNTFTGLSWATDTRYKLKRGTTWSGAAINSTASGGDGTPIVFEPYSSGANPKVAPTGSAAGFNINGRAYIEINDIDVDARASSGNAILLQAGANHVKIQRGVIQADAASCVSLSGSSVSAYSELDIIGVTMTGGLTGVRFLGTVDGLAHTGIRVNGCRISGQTNEGIRLTLETGLTTSTINGIGLLANYIRNTGYQSISVRAVYAASDDDTPPALWGVGCLVGGNDIADCGTAGVESGAIHLLGVENWSAWRNKVRDCYTKGALIQGQRRKNGSVWGNDLSGAVPASSIDGNGIFVDRFDTDTKVFRNRIADCYGLDGVDNSGAAIAMWMATNVYVFSNLAQRCKHGLDAGGNAVQTLTNANAYCNTFADMTHTGFQGDSDGTGMDANSLALRNNVFVRCPTAISVRGQALTTVDYNAFEDCDTLYSGGQSSGANDITSGLLLSSGLRPRSGSPLLTMGADLGYLRDLAGAQSKLHIGAYGASRLVPA